MNNSVNSTADGGSTTSEHYVFRNNPLQLKSQINKMIRIVTAEKTEHVGTVYTIDPVTGSYVLVGSSKNEKATVEVIPGHVIQSASTVVSTSGIEDADVESVSRFQSLLQNGNEGDVDEDTKAARKKTVSAWLRRHFVPVTESSEDPDSLTIMNALTVVAPFRPDNCYSENEIILGKIQGLLASMPKEWKENE